MSFGLAFAKGLVGGFTKNIEREIEARGADDQRLANLEDFLFQKHAEVSAKGKGSVPKALGEMLQDAKSKMDKRGRINLIGSTGDRLSLNMGELNTALSEADDATRFISYGSKNNRYNITPITQNMFEKDFEKDQLAYSVAWIKSLDRHFADGGQEEVDKFQKYLNENPLQYKKFMRDWTFHTSEYKNLAGKSYVSEGIEAYKFPTIMDRHSSATMLQDILEGGKKYSEEEIEINTLYDENKNKDDGSDSKITNKIKQVSITSDLNQKFGENWKENTIFLKREDGEYIPFQFADEEDGLTAAEKIAAIKALAQKNGYGTTMSAVTRFIIDFRKQYETKLLPANFLGYIKEAGDVFAKPELVREAYSDMFHAINLQHLGAGKKLVNLPDGGAKVLEYLNNNFLRETEEGSKIFNRAAAIRAFAAVQNLPQSDIALLQSQDKGTTTVGINKFIDDMFLNIMGITATEFGAKFEANKRTLKNVQKLKTLKLTEGTAAGTLVSWMKETLGNIKVPTGAFEQMADFIGRGKNKSNVTKESLIAIMNKLKLRREDGTLLSSVKNLSEQEALMIALAADMARAVDPAGRLSNQDFEVQLRRLGKAGIFQSKVAELSALETVITDFEDRFKRIQVIGLALADELGGKRLTPLGLKMLYANKKYNAIEDQIVGGEEGSSEPKFFSPDEKFVDEDGRELNRFILLKNGNYFDRKDQVEVPKDKFKTQI